MQTYSRETEETMHNFYNTLNEKDRRRYAGVEALKLGHGGLKYIARVLGCSRRTVKKGVREVSGLSSLEVQGRIGEPRRIRQPGGGRRRYYKKWLDINEKFLLVLRDHTAGDPMDEKIRWTDLTPAEVVWRLKAEHGILVCIGTVKKLFKKHDYRKRKAQKKQTMKEVPQRNEQFENIFRLRDEYQAAGNPIVSMDTKKKEHLGNFYREGRLYTLEELHAWDHDFKNHANGVIIPHSLYDVNLNTGYIQIGTSRDTGEFACDSFRHWWYNYGCVHYRNATSILVLCDGGGSNSSRHYLFKEDLQALADEIGIEIRIAHYPPYCSKYNPIEHRLFPHVTRACQGVFFTSVELVRELMEKTSTTTGLTAFVHIIDKVYRTGRKVADGFKENMQIVFDDFLPQWNYRAIPQSILNGKVI